jgi:hypothetical protein
MTEMCEILPGHRYLMPAGSTTCKAMHVVRCALALCVHSPRGDMRQMIERYGALTRDAAREARAGHRLTANRLAGERREVMAWLDLNPCASCAMIEEVL